jgi:mono/diheme cytochrome c family protein
MKKSLFVVMVIVVLGTLLLSACSGGTSGGTQRPTPPAPYAGKTNPVAGNADAAAKGKDLFTAQCQACHGEKGLGDGPAGSALNPKPANLQTSAKEASDAYMFWRISEGGTMAPFNSSMPPHKDTMKEDQIWQVVTYIKTLK